MDRFADWVEAYVRAWRSNSPDDIAALFADDATYLTEPYAQAWKGRDEIVERWLARKDDPGDWDFRYEVVGRDGNLGFVQGEATYTGDSPRTYSNLWTIRLDDSGRCTEYVEWWMQHPSS